MKIVVNKDIRKIRTKCPHCGEMTFSPLRYALGNLAMSVFDVRTRKDIQSGNISIGGPGIVVYYKRCLNCGYMAPFDADIVEKNGKL